MANTIRDKDLAQRIKMVSEILPDIEPEELIILCHADHDGFTSSALFDAYFLQEEDKRTEIVYPHKNRYYSLIFKELLERKPKHLLILDALVARHAKLLKRLVENKCFIINMDHHDLVELSDENYLSLNPHEWGIEYLNSSGLAWLVLRSIDQDYYEQRAWVAGIGAAQDLCFDDNELLYDAVNRVGLLDNCRSEFFFNSRLMRIAKMVDAACDEGRYDHTYSKIIEATKDNSIGVLLEDEDLLKSYNHYLKAFEETYDDFRRRHQEYGDINLITYEFTGEMKTSSIADVCERHRKPCIYLGYREGLLGFCSLFYDFDVRELARLYGGSGPHPRIAGGRTRKGFREVVERIRQFLKLKKTQKQIDYFTERS